MLFARALLAGIALVSFASGQEARVAFTSVPAVVTTGESYNITWGGGDGTAVTITLRKGDPSNLDTIGVLADNVEGTSYKWDVSRSLEPSNDYALQITQGQDQINYSGQFSVVKSSGSSTASADGSSTTSMPSNSTTTMTLGHNSTMTMTSSSSSTSTASLPRTIPTSAPSALTSATSTPTAQSTSAPDSGAIQMTSSAAFVIGVVGAVMFLS